MPMAELKTSLLFNFSLFSVLEGGVAELCTYVIEANTILIQTLQL